MSMLSLRYSVLLMGMRTRYKVRDSKLVKERIKFLIFTFPIGLHSNNFAIKKAFNESLKFSQSLENLILEFNKIDLSKFTIVINKTHIILIPTRRFSSRTPHIRKKNKFQGVMGHTSRNSVW
jgi:hypothetical protein